MTADPALAKATYADLEAVPPHRAAQIIDGRRETRPRSGPRYGGAASFPFDALFPFDAPAPDTKPSEEA
ncbi:hypothetical protein ACFSCV_01600 [Methylopila henanensis]|uniref:Uncharacterized protein n=1 Tax=Methylopila henanensis TaxID=873516 RepID=A0ABW4K2P1_9HYPH